MPIRAVDDFLAFRLVGHGAAAGAGEDAAGAARPPFESPASSAAHALPATRPRAIAARLRPNADRRTPVLGAKAKLAAKLRCVLRSISLSLVETVGSRGVGFRPVIGRPAAV